MRVREREREREKKRKVSRETDVPPLWESSAGLFSRDMTHTYFYAMCISLYISGHKGVLYLYVHFKTTHIRKKYHQ